VSSVRSSHRSSGGSRHMSGVKVSGQSTCQVSSVGSSHMSGVRSSHGSGARSIHGSGVKCRVKPRVRGQVSGQATGQVSGQATKPHVNRLGHRSGVGSSVSPRSIQYQVSPKSGQVKFSPKSVPSQFSIKSVPSQFSLKSVPSQSQVAKSQVNDQVSPKSSPHVPRASRGSDDQRQRRIVEFVEHRFRARHDRHAGSGIAHHYVGRVCHRKNTSRVSCGKKPTKNNNKTNTIVVSKAQQKRGSLGTDRRSKRGKTGAF
jgi:hypothetical protein